MLKRIILISIISLFAFSRATQAQEKRCIPNVWKGEEVKGIVYLSNGDTLKGKFTHLTPYNDIKTTHVIYQASKKDKEYLNRAAIKAYYDSKTKEYRLKVYVDVDSSLYKKGCFFDQGKFLEVLIDGKYTLLKDELNYYSSINAYSQSANRDIYYLLLPSALLIEVDINHLKEQLLSLITDAEDIDAFTNADSFTVEEMMELITFLNAD